MGATTLGCRHASTDFDDVGERNFSVLEAHALDPRGFKGVAIRGIEAFFNKFEFRGVMANENILEYLCFCFMIMSFLSV